MPTVLEGLSNFLTARSATHNAPELLALWGPHMETQVNASPGNGEPVENRKNTWTDGTYEWHSIRIPKNAYSEPEFSDYPLKYPFDLHAEGIGMTGWDWKKRVSRHLGFDFDSITGHAAGIGISRDDLDTVKKNACKIPWVEVRKSTGGKGLHLYVYFDEAGVPTENHTVHAALGRAVLGLMSTETGFDFASQIDACGGNMWIWHRKMSAANEGLMLIKAATQKLNVADLPANWRDHVEVVSRSRTRVRVEGIDAEDIDAFESLVSCRQKTSLDKKHKAVIDALLRSGYSTFWVPDHHMLQTHTCALKKIVEEIKIEGMFNTNSQGRNPGEQNCFMYPLDNGAWKVYRYSKGSIEHPSWQQDKEGWTTCYFNRKPSLDEAASALGGAERSAGGFEFDTAKEAVKVIEAMGEAVRLPEELEDREAHVIKNKDGQVVLAVKRKDKEEARPKGWASKRGGWWEKVFKMLDVENHNETQFDQYDKVIRQLVTPAEEDAGWMLRSKKGIWQRFSTEKVKMRLINLSIPESEVKALLGGAIGEAWTLVNLPFQDEYPGDRQWNLGAAQFVYKPIPIEDETPLHHPHWDKILKHCGNDLTATLKTLDWAQNAGVQTREDYLKSWIACAFRCPFEPLPYLFFYGSQNCGKSIFHESLSALITKGVVRADRALTNQGDFCGELANAIICVVEEKDISKSSGAYNKIKDWVTSRMISIRKMRTDSYEQPNTTHWIQCANDPGACPILPGDTRITSIYVYDLEPDQEIPKMILMDRLREEAPAFMRTLLDLELPPIVGRLRLPVLWTPNKDRLIHTKQEMLVEEASFKNSAVRTINLKAFVETKCRLIPNRCVSKNKIFRACNDWLRSKSQHGYGGKTGKGQFSKDLLNLFRDRITSNKKSRNHKRIPCFLGITLQSSEKAGQVNIIKSDAISLCASNSSGDTFDHRLAS
jgi:hypothetical protein